LKPDAEGHWPPPFNFGGKPCLVIRTPEGEIRAFNAVCTHVDCTVAYRADKGDIFCNCHNGVYDLNGRNVSGPPPRPLEVYKVTLRSRPSERPGQEEIVVSRTT
jgi:Rieske Fe-S protein